MARRVALSAGGSLAAEAILERLHESGLAPDSLVLLDAESERGKRAAYGDKQLVIRALADVDLADFGLLLMAAADAELERMALERGCLVAGHELDGDEPPLFVAGGAPPPDLDWSATRLRLAGAELACLLPVLRALNGLRPLRRAGITLIKSAEFRGRAGVEELAGQTVNLLNARKAEVAVFPQQLAFNLLPEASDERLERDLRDMVGENGVETRLQTLVAPLFHGLVAGLQLEFADAVSPVDCGARLDALDGVIVKSPPISPISDCNQSFSCVISHLRQAPGQTHNLQFWMITDPLRFGLANNYGAVTEFLLNSFL